jgi:hypothetical protein
MEGNTEMGCQSILTAGVMGYNETSIMTQGPPISTMKHGETSIEVDDTQLTQQTQQD